jgi:hypothetical protein
MGISERPFRGSPLLIVLFCVVLLCVGSYVLGAHKICERSGGTFVRGFYCVDFDRFEACVMPDGTRVMYEPLPLNITMPI